ncbi:MAG: PmoA family protein [Demequina sp.]
MTDHDSHASFTVGEVEIAHYVYRPDTIQFESPKPFIHPLRTLAGREVSLFRPHDHVWHKGIAWTLANVNGHEHNFWGGPTYTSRAQWYEGLPNNGSQDHASVVNAGSSGDTAEFAHELVWNAQGGGEVFREARSLTARVLDGDSWVLGWSTRMTNVTDGPLRLGSPTTEGRENAGYGGLFWRGPRSFNDGTVIVPGGARDAEEVRGERHEWLGFVGKHDGDNSSSTLVFVDPGDNAGGTPRWFVRSNIFGCVCPAPFFTDEIELAPGETAQFRYAVVVADGESDLARTEALAAAGRSELGDSA